MHSISKNIYLALNGLYSEVCRLNSMEQIIQRMPRNLHKKESISTDHPMEGKMEHNARDATRHSENKVRVIFLVLKRHLYEAWLTTCHHLTFHLNNHTGIIWEKANPSIWIGVCHQGNEDFFFIWYHHHWQFYFLELLRWWRRRRSSSQSPGETWAP